MKNLITLIALGIVVSCQPQGDLAEKQAELSEKQKALTELKAEISKLKDEVAQLDTSVVARKATPVKVVSLATEKFEHYVELTGTITSEQNIMISAEASGRITSIKVKEGQRVKKGEVLITIDNESVLRQLEEARSVYELAETTYKKRKNLWDQSIGSEINYLQAKNNYETAKSRLDQTQKRYENTLITSPINGNVDQIDVNLGEMIGMGTPAVRVVDVNDVEIEAELSENYLKSVKTGDDVKVSIPSVGYESESKVNFVSQVINPANRSFLIKVAVNNKDGVIKPNLLANLMIRDYTNEAALVVPSKAIGKDLKGAFVFRAVTDDEGKLRAQKAYITKGTSFGARTEIADGISAGDKVIVAGSDEVNQNEEIIIL